MSRCAPQRHGPDRRSVTRREGDSRGEGESLGSETTRLRQPLLIAPGFSLVVSTVLFQILDLMLLRARIVLPVTQPPIEDGAVRIVQNRIEAVGPWKHLAKGGDSIRIDLGNVILLPGLVNAHCHLDYTGMAGQIPQPKSFPDWIKSLLALKAHWGYSEYAQSWLAGVGMLLRHGVTTVADIEAVPELLPEASRATPLRVCSFFEMTGVRSRRPAREIVEESTARIDALPPGRGVPGLSPHAPYSTSPDLLRLSAQAARRRRWRLAVHVAESEAEFDMFMSRRGPFFDWLKSQREMADCGLGSPVQHLERHGVLGENLLAIHVNYLAPGDAELLGGRRVSVVHCPRSHVYFQHAEFPRRSLAAAGVNLCLGTDSLATVLTPRRQKPELDLFVEMRAFASQAPEWTPEQILAMTTTNSARAMGLAGRVGEIAPGALADLIVLPYRGPARGVYEAVLHHSGGVSGTLVNGEWALDPNET